MSMKPLRRTTRWADKAEMATRPVGERGGRMLKLKGCPRCQGDILTDHDHFGWYEQCIQCGYQRDLKVAEEAKCRARGNVQEHSKPEGITMKEER